MSEGRLLLGANTCYHQQQQDDYRYFLLKHVDNNDNYTLFIALEDTKYPRMLLGIQLIIKKSIAI
jgi:hypothetical protein